jgi:hypothetical protein
VREFPKNSCKFFDNERANIEMTMSPIGEEAWKMEWYLYKLHLTQNIKGGGKDYSSLRRTYHLSFLGENYYGDSVPFHCFEHYDRKNNISLGGLTSLYVVELKKIDALAKNPPETWAHQECWALFLRFASERGKQELVSELAEPDYGRIRPDGSRTSGGNRAAQI